MRWITSFAPVRGPLVALALLASAGVAFGQTTSNPTTPAPATPSTPTVTTPATPPTPSAPAATPAAPASPAPATSAPSAASPSVATPPTPSAATPPVPDSTVGASPGDASISQALDVPSRPAAIISGSATWDDGFKTLKEAFAKLNDALGKNGIGVSGHPLAVFTSTDDAGFKYSAMMPIAKAPEGKTELTPDIKLGETPSGKAIRFQHRASYDDIDSTYEAITAYLDEKGLESRNMFAEEYLTDMKAPDDPSLQVDIYVFLK